MIVETQIINGRYYVHERGHYKLVIATMVEGGDFCIALVNFGDGLTPLNSGMLVARLKPGTTIDQAEKLLGQMNDLIESWEMKWQPGPPDDSGGGTVLPLKRAAWAFTPAQDYDGVLRL